MPNGLRSRPPYAETPKLQCWQYASGENAVLANATCGARALPDARCKPERTSTAPSRRCARPHYLTSGHRRRVLHVPDRRKKAIAFNLWVPSTRPLQLAGILARLNRSGRLIVSAMSRRAHYFGINSAIADQGRCCRLGRVRETIKIFLEA